MPKSYLIPPRLPRAEATPEVPEVMTIHPGRQTKRIAPTPRRVGDRRWTQERGQRNEVTQIKEYEPKDPGMIERAYAGFLELPVRVVLAVLWLTGAVLLGSCALALYLFWLLLRALAGA